MWQIRTEQLNEGKLHRKWRIRIKWLFLIIWRVWSLHFLFIQKIRSNILEKWTTFFRPLFFSPFLFFSFLFYYYLFILTLFKCPSFKFYFLKQKQIRQINISKMKDEIRCSHASKEYFYYKCMQQFKPPYQIWFFICKETKNTISATCHPAFGHCPQPLGITTIGVGEDR